MEHDIISISERLYRKVRSLLSEKCNLITQFEYPGVSDADGDSDDDDDEIRFEYEWWLSFLEHSDSRRGWISDVVHKVLWWLQVQVSVGVGVGGGSRRERESEQLVEQRRVLLREAPANLVVAHCHFAHANVVERRDAPADEYSISYYKQNNS